MMRPVPAGLGVYRPPMRTASSANQRKNSAPYLTSPMLSRSTLPISRVISVARSSARSVMSSKTARSTSPRLRGAVAAHSACTPAAASSAAMASSAVALAIEISTESSDGSRTSNVDEPSRSSPPIQMPVGTDFSRAEVSMTLSYTFVQMAALGSRHERRNAADPRHLSHPSMAGAGSDIMIRSATNTSANCSTRTPHAAPSWR